MKYVLLLCALLPAAFFAQESEQISWKDVADIEFSETYVKEVDAYYWKPNFSDYWRELDGSWVTIEAYAHCIDDSTFILTNEKVMPWSCSFNFVCPIELNTSHLETWVCTSPKPLVRVTGRLELNEYDVYKCNLILHDVIIGESTLANAEEAALPEWAKLLYSENPNAFEVRDAYEEYYRTHEFVKTIHTQNYKRWVNRLRGRVDEVGYITPINPEEQRHQEQVIAGTRGGQELWTYAGPEIHYAADGSLTPVSNHSNVYCHDRSATNPNLLYCGTESGGLYRSTDQGSTWEFVTKNMLIGSVSCVTIHPENDDIIIFSAENDLYRSTDGGATWNVIGQPSFVSQNVSAWEIEFNPENPDIVYAACNVGFFRSTDGGDNWTEIMFNESQVVQFKPGDPSVVYTLQHLPNTDEFKFYKSTDYGASFTMFDNGWFEELPGYDQINMYGGRIAVTEADPNRIYALLVGYGQYDADSYTNGWVGTWVSYDGGETWEFPHGEIGTPYNAEHQNLMNFSADDGDYTQILYNTTMIASQLNADEVLIGGLNLWRSTDACVTYQGVGGYIGGLPYFHVDQQELKVYKTGENSQEVWCSNDGGICYSTDFMQTIANKNRGIMAVNLWGYDQGWNEDVMVGGRYHNGNFGYFETYPDHEALSLGGGEAPTGYVNYSDENKTYFSDIGGRILPEQMTDNPAYFSMTLSPNESYWFNGSSRIMFDNEYFNVAWLGRENKLYRSTNGGGSFSEFHAFGSNVNNPVLWIEQSYANSDYMYVHQRTGNSSKIWRTADGGETWDEMDLPQTLSNLFFSLSATNPDEIWLGFTYGSNGNKIYHTTNAGADWENLTTSLMDNREIWGVAHAFGTDGGVYLALLNGTVLYRNNSLGEWITYSDGLPYSTQPIRIVPMYKKGLIRLATWNLGVWEAPLYEPSGLIADFSADYGTFYCPGDPVHFVDHSVAGPDATYAWSFPGGNPSTSDEKYPTVVYEASGTYDVTLTVTQDGVSDTRTRQQYISSEEMMQTEFTEDFETGTFQDSWKFAHSTGGSSNWAIGNAASGFGNGSYSMYFDNYWNDVQGNRDEVWTGKRYYLITADSGNLLSFDVAYAEYGYPYSDTLAVLISTDCGASWTEMYVKGGDDLATAPDNGNPFVPSASEWRHEELLLDEFLYDEQVFEGEMIIAFQNRGRWGNIIYVDNINLEFEVGVDETTTSTPSVSAFPNPAENQVNIGLAHVQSGIYSLELINALGQVVQTQSINHHSPDSRHIIDISTLSSGMYELRVVNEDTQLVRSIIKK